jgi:hypothetical protein
LLRAAREPRLQLSELTFTPELEIAQGSPVHRRLGDPAAPPWARLIAAHLDQWYARFHHSTMQHDALAVATASGHPFVDHRREHVVIDERGRTTVAAGGGFDVWLSTHARLGDYLGWLAGVIDTALGSPVSHEGRR